MKFFLATRLFATVKIFGCQNGVKGEGKEKSGTFANRKSPQNFIKFFKKLL